MYFQKDYVLRMIEMMGELIHRILSAAKDAEANGELEEISNKACGLPMTMLRNGDPDMLARTLEEAQRFLAAELLMIAYEVDRRTQTEDALLPLLSQAALLYSSLREPDYALPASDRVADILRDRLADLPAHVLLAAADLHEFAGALAPAEDAYFAAIELQPANVAAALAFYDRIAALDDRALLAGGLSREEIDEGRAALN